jgi:hypothetical protein
VTVLAPPRTGPSPCAFLSDRLDGLPWSPLNGVAPRPVWRPSFFGNASRRTEHPVRPPHAIAPLIDRLPTTAWSIDRDSAAALATLFQAAAPTRVVEFGSGASTIVFAAMCAESGRDARVISFDEKETYAERTRARLAELDLADWATVIVSPVVRRRLDGWTGWVYVMQPEVIEAALGGHAVDFTFVDGPASWLTRRGDCRYGTLLAVRPWASRRSVFVADDALRRRDLAIIRRWQRLPYVEVGGVVPVGHGIAFGHLAGTRHNGASHV